MGIGHRTINYKKYNERRKFFERRNRVRMTLNWMWSWRRCWVKANLIWVVGNVDGRWIELDWRQMNIEIVGRWSRLNFEFRSWWKWIWLYQSERVTWMLCRRSSPGSKGHGVIARCGSNAVLSVVRVARPGGMSELVTAVVRQPGQFARLWLWWMTATSRGDEKRTARSEPRTRAYSLFQSSASR